MHAPRETVSVIFAIATAGRREQMRHTMVQLATLKPQPLAVWVAPATNEDFDADQARSVLAATPVHVVQPSQKGSTFQRNAILRSLAGASAECICFIDDDFYPAADYAGRLAEVFAANPGSIAFTGRPAADGAPGPGITHETAASIVQRMDAEQPLSLIKVTYGTYGCNMGFRLQPILDAGVFFDEELPLYAWLEDIDFSRRVAHLGAISESTLLRGVHLGIKAGRVSGLRFGYSQVANPWYFFRKGSMSFSYAFRQMMRNVSSNAVRSFYPESWVDRRGRLTGNAIAFIDILSGTAHPSRIKSL